MENDVDMPAGRTVDSHGRRGIRKSMAHSHHTSEGAGHCQILSLDTELLEEIKALHTTVSELKAEVQLLELLNEISALRNTLATLPQAKEANPQKTRAKSKGALDWDNLPEWLNQKQAAEAADLCVNTFKPWALSRRIRTRPYGKWLRYHRDDIRGFRS